MDQKEVAQKQSPPPQDATPPAAEVAPRKTARRFYTELTKREDVRELLRRLARK